MSGRASSLRAGILVCAVVCGIGLCRASHGFQALENTGETTVPQGLAGVWDPNRYISIDEIQPGMEAYTLTVYKGTEVEKFGLEVLSVIHRLMPDRDAILVRGTDERFIHTGPVAGCSGSPVYINGRLAGAIAFGWLFSKDPLYGVTPIAEMLRAGNSPGGQVGGGASAGGPGLKLDFSRPIDFSEVESSINSALRPARGDYAGHTILPSPLVVSGVPDSVQADLQDRLGSLGFMVVPAGAATATDVCEPGAPGLTPGACLAVPLVGGDITMEVVGTVTEVRGDEVYGFGHSFLGYGLVDLPMATGQVHAVVPSVMRSFKVARSRQVVGALTTDESVAVRGKLGAPPRMIPLTINVNRYNDSQQRRYECRIVNNRLLTPLLLRAAVSSAALMRGDLPPDNLLRYKIAVAVDGPGAPGVAFENVSTGQGLSEMIRDCIGPVGLLLNNPYKPVQIKSLDFDIRIEEKNVTSAIWSVELSRWRVKPGEELDVQVAIETFQAEKQAYAFSFVVPEDIPPGTYQLTVCGGYGYEDFLRRAVPHRFVPENLDSLITTMNDILAIDRDRLYCILVLPAGGVAVENAELPELPATKAMVLADAKRALTLQVLPNWIEKSVKTGTVTVDRKVMNVVVEK